MSIREYANKMGHEIVGKLRRKPDQSGAQYYLDDAMNEYLVNKRSGVICIVTFDGGVL